MQQRIEVGEVISDAAFGTFQLGVFCLCATLAFLDGYDLNVVSFAAPVIAKAWQLPVSSFGTIFTAGIAGLLIGTLALTGFPLFAGYFSKDAIIESAYASHNPLSTYAYVLTVAAAGLTSFYSWRLIFKTFFGEPHDQEHYEAAHESPMWMLVPIGVLAVGSIFSGFPFRELFAGHGVEEFFRDSVKMNPHILEDMEHMPTLLGWLPFVMMAVGFLVSWLFYIRRPYLPVELAKQQPLLYQFLLNKWYFDELYDAIFVRPAFAIGTLFWKGGDGAIIDGFGPDGISARVLDVTRGAVRLQSGYIYQYAFAMLLGVAALATWYLFGGAR